ncbi:HK97 gp10 family phage protein [Clostridium sp. OS1-26]|uniref:HK97 gp10 family phage protein n=1 Tax=Clostridium sp. OS1-26 TaxID=3070681 RepID=UPI0027DEF35B|nr:HK97 gp10 family phage protein [Clostridium sp. OS1-26]WML35350.1 HK97 gp10 family phage protein [Clostridium sp. OS1-26]
MARLGNFDYSEFKKLAESFQTALDTRVIERWIKEFLLEMAFRAERKIKKRTPVDSGHLRRNWQVGSVVKQGNAYIIEIFNNVEYASYLEYGHRTKNHKGWVEGRFMATISMAEIERELPRFMESKQVELLNQILNGR